MLLMAQLDALSLNGLLTHPTWVVFIIAAFIGVITFTVSQLQILFSRGGKRCKMQGGFPRRYVSRRLGGMLFIVLLIVVPGVACVSPSDCTGGTIEVGGSTALQPLVSKAAESYHTMCPQATIVVNQNVASSEDGLSKVVAGKIQIGTSDLMTSRMDLVDHPVAVTIYVLVLNRNVAVTNLTTSQIQGIYNGLVTNWNQIGGPDLPIYVVSRTSTSGTRKTFEKYVFNGLEKLPLGLRHIEVDAAGIVASEVAKTSGAIGYVDLGTATKQNLPTVQIDNIEASSQKVKGGS